MAAKDKIFKQLSKVFYVVDMPAGGGTTTLATSAPAAGATSITVASITNFSNGDLIRVGSGETTELCLITGAPSAGAIPIAAGLVYAHAIGEPVVEQTAYDLGAIEEGGFEFDVSGQSTDIPVATQRLAFTTLTGFVSAEGQLKLPTFTLPGFAIATGMLQSAISGAGTTASPTQLATNGSEFSVVQNACLVAVGTTFDGSYVRAELYGCDFDYTQIQFQLTRGQLAAIPIKVTAANGLVLYSSNYGFAVDSSLAASNGKVWDALTEVGVMVDTGTSTTTTAPQNIGDTTLVLTAATNVAAGVWLRIGTGSAAQFALVNGVVSLTATLRTKLYYAVANGATVTVVTPTPFAGTSKDGFSLNVGGSVTEMNMAERRMSIGLRPGAAPMSWSFGTIAATLANFAYALGIPQAQVSGGRLPVQNNVATANLDGVYCKGTLKDGTTATLLATGNIVDLSQFKFTMDNAGDPKPVPLAGKPTSYVALLQNP